VGRRQWGSGRVETSSRGEFTSIFEEPAGADLGAGAGVPPPWQNCGGSTLMVDTAGG